MSFFHEAHFSLKDWCHRFGGIALGINFQIRFRVGIGLRTGVGCGLNHFAEVWVILGFREDCWGRPGARRKIGSCFLARQKLWDDIVILGRQKLRSRGVKKSKTVVAGSSAVENRKWRNFRKYLNHNHVQNMAFQF